MLITISKFIKFLVQKSHSALANGQRITRQQVIAVIRVGSTNMLTSHQAVTQVQIQCHHNHLCADEGSEKIAELADEHLFQFLYILTESQDLTRA